MQQLSIKRLGFTRAELFVVLLIISVTAAALYPVLSGGSVCRFPKPRQEECATHLKQIGMAVLMYAQDNDGTLPPAYTPIPRSRQTYGDDWVLLWLGKNQMVAPDRTATFSLEDGLLFPYVPQESYRSCSEVTFSGSSVTYVMNDLCGGAKTEAFTAAANTVMMMDGEGAFPVIGHALGDPRKRFQKWDYSTERLLLSGTVGEGTTHHSGGANYLLADGHVKWNSEKSVFFPARESTDKTHRDQQTHEPIGPDPSGGMVYQGRKYAATFHLR